MTRPEEQKAVLESPKLAINAPARGDPSFPLTAHWPEFLLWPHPTASREDVPTYLSLDGSEGAALSTLAKESVGFFSVK